MCATGRLEDAEACFTSTMLQLNPSNFEALNNLGNLRKERGQLADAERFYRQALAIDFGNARNMEQPRAGSSPMRTAR